MGFLWKEKITLVLLIFLSVPCNTSGQNVHSPVFPAQPMTHSVSEVTSVGDDVFTCVATDDDTGLAATLRYSVVGGSGSASFSVNDVTCEVTVAQELDYESVSEYDVIIEAVDLDPLTPKSATATFVIQVTDSNEFPPTFINVPSMPVPVPEDSATGITILTCTVSDGDSPLAPSGQHSFRITGGDAGNFILDNTTCDLTLAESLNFENVSQYDVTVMASDLDPVDPREASMVFSIQVLDVNEKPTFKNLPGDPVLVREDVVAGTGIFTCSGRDPDLSTLPRGQLEYRITGGNEAAMFSLDPDTCNLTLSGSLDFEAVEEFQLTLKAQDKDPQQAMSVSRPLVIAVVDVNEHAPTFVNVPSSPTEIGEHNSVGSAVITCTASDLDSATQPSGQLQFTITGGNEEGRFTLQDPDTCEVTVAQPLDFETTELYSLTLTVLDLDPTKTFSDTHTFHISVTDENDAPVLQSVTAMPTVPENSPAGTFVFSCSAADQDDALLLSGQVTYSILSGNTNDSFTLLPPCTIETSQPMDHEAQVFYDLEIGVTDLDPADPKTDALVYRVKVTDINDNTPYFFHVPPVPLAVMEDTSVGVPFLNCSGEDDDTPLELTGHVRYEIIGGNEEGFFAVDPESCDMHLVKALDYEKKTLTFNITVRIYDLDPIAPRSVEQDYQFCVANVNDNKPKFVSTLASPIQLVENVPLGRHLGNCSAEDGDSPLYPSGHVRYVMKGGNSLSLFYLDPYTCDLYVNGLLDFEQKKSHTLKIVADDLDPDNPLRSKEMKVKVRLQDENDNGPTCQSRVMITEVSEDTVKNAVVLTMDCSDLDQGRSSSSLRFFSLSGTETLSVEKMTGNIKLRRRLDWDNVTESREHELLVRVRDNSDEPMSTTVTVRIHLTDSDDITPVFQEQDYVESVREDIPRGSTILKVSATDSDGPNTPASTVEYDLQTVPDPDCFLLHPYTGQVIVKRALDAEVFSQGHLQVYAFSSDRRQANAVANVVILVQDVNDSGPEFSQELYYISVQEGSTHTDPVLRVEAQDSADDDDFGVLLAIEDGPLDINTVSGDVTVKGQLDFETQYYYAVRVEARDMGTPPLTATATIILTVTPLNEFDPVWISGTDFVVSEDTSPGTVLFQLNATDDDSSWDGLVNFDRASPLTPDSPFTVDQSGRIVLAAPLDRETTHSYSFSVVAYDLSVSRGDRRSVTTTMHVTVSDVNDLAPECARVPVAVVVFPWVGFTIASVDCSVDDDVTNGPLSYRIDGGNVDGAFQINDTDGRLTALHRPRQELHELRVEVSDGGTPAMTSLVDVVILVEPGLTLTSLPGTVRLREDVEVGTLVHEVATRGSFTTLEFELISGNVDKLFHLHSGSGVITLVRHLDREVTSQHVLGVQVVDERGQMVTGTLTVDVDDVNDNAPVFNPVFSVLELPETASPGVIVGYWTAADVDQGSNAALTYSLLDSGSGRFSVDNSSGAISLVSSLDHEAGDTVTLVVSARDSGDLPLSATASIRVEVLNEDEHSPHFVSSSGEVTVAENSALGVVLFVLQALDEDAPDVITYTLTTVDTPFLVLPHSGQVMLRSPLDRETLDQYDLHFVATNDQGVSASLDVKILVEDVDDNDPIFSSTVYEFHVPHNTQADVIVGHVTVSDDDVGENADFEISIVSGNGAGHFTVAGSGALKTSKPLNYDDIREFVLVLRADRRGSLPEYRFSEAAVRIQVLSASTEPKFDLNSITLTVLENVIVNTVICDVNATALGATEGDDGNLRYVIRTGNDKGLFFVKEHTGELQVAGEVDYEKDSQFVLIVDAENKNDAAAKDSVTITINVINVNDNAPYPSSAIFRFSVDEDSPQHTLVGQVVFTDDDAGVFGELDLTISGCPKFVIDSSTGDITVKEQANLGDDVRHGCIVTATDGGDPPLLGMTSVVIEVDDVNNHSPQFAGAPYNLDVYENTAAGSTLTTIIVTDPDDGEGGEVTLSIKSGDDDGVFSLNSSTGQLLLTSDLNASLTSQFLLHLQAKDGGADSQTALTTLTINVIDVNDHAPVFSALSASLEVTVGRLDPPGTELAVLAASDEDVGDNSLISFAITAGNAAGLFFIDSDSGQLITRGWLTGAQNVHALTVTASDQGRPPLTTSTIVTIYISPPLPSDTDLSLSFQSFSLPENASAGSEVGTLDPFPAASGAVDYVIVSGNLDDSFEVVMEGGGVGRLVVKGGLDYERRRVHYLWVNVSEGGADSFRKLVQVNVTDINDHTPQFADGPTLTLHVVEHTPAGHTVWTLTVVDADQPDTNGPLQFRAVTVAGPDMMTVTAEGQIQLASSPDYDSFQTAEAVISVWDSDTPRLSSSISVTLKVIDVAEREVVTVTPAVTMYISTEIAHNSNEGQVVYQLTAADFGLTEPATSTTSFVSFHADSAFTIHPQTGDVTVSDAQQLAVNAVYFQWVVCKIVTADDSSESEIVTLRIDTFDKYENVVAVQFRLDLVELEAQREALTEKLQQFFSSQHRVGIYSIIAYGTSARRRLLAATSLVLIYVVEDLAMDTLNNITGPKTFLTQQLILQVLQQSSDGTPVAGLTTGSLAADLVMPYGTGGTESSTPFVDTLYFPIIVAVVCVLVLVVVIFVIGCVVYKAKRKRSWSRESATKDFRTPAPAFFIGRDGLFTDDVSIGSSTSLLDDDSGMGDSFGSQSPPRKSLTPSSTDSGGSVDNDLGGNELLIPATLWSGHAGRSRKVIRKQSGNSASEAETSGGPRRKRFLWRKSETKNPKSKFVYSTPKPPVTWLPSLPDDPRHGRRASTVSTASYMPSDPSSRRRTSQNWDLSGSGTPRLAGSDTSSLSSRQSSATVDWGISPYAVPQAGRRTSAALVTTPVFTTGISAVDGKLRSAPVSSAYTPSFAPTGDASSSSLSSEPKPSSLGQDSEGEEREVKATIPGHLVSWKPKRNTVKIFNEKLRWKAVSTIPKATSLPRRPAKPGVGVKADEVSETHATPPDVSGT